MSTCSLADRVAARDTDEDRLVVAAREELDLAALHEVGEVTDDVGPIALEPIEERAGEMERRFHFGVPIERSHERRIRALGYVSEYMGEVPRWLVLVENQRQTQPIGHLEVILPNFVSPYGLRTERPACASGISPHRRCSLRLRM